jgi:hypothetical protein
MLFRSTVLLGSLVFLNTLFVSGQIAESQTQISAEKPVKEWRVINGFRSASFGMDEKQVMQAIAKDFRISRRKVSRAITPSEKTKTLSIQTPKLMHIGGPADIVYIFGYKSKKLIQVNIDWGAGVSADVDRQEVIDVANLLKSYFDKKRFKKDTYIYNSKISSTRIVVFRGQDEKGRMILLRLEIPKSKEIENKKVSLYLSYISDLKNPDVFSGIAK